MTDEELDNFVETIPRDATAKSVAGVIEAFQIFAKYLENGLNQQYFFEGQHDKIFVYVDPEKLLPQSDDGKRLIALGFYPNLELDNWYANT